VLWCDAQAIEWALKLVEIMCGKETSTKVGDPMIMPK
jgi:hypothetical protein